MDGERFGAELAAADVADQGFWTVGEAGRFPERHFHTTGLKQDIEPKRSVPNEQAIFSAGD